MLQGEHAFCQAFGRIVFFDAQPFLSEDLACVQLFGDDMDAASVLPMSFGKRTAMRLQPAQPR